MHKPRLSFANIWNMNFGYLGIQFAFGLQMANMSAIYAKLGADEASIPMLWLAAPLTGLLVQPVIGAMSDRTWTWLGRRRPYFAIGAMAAAFALFFMPTSPSIWIAACLLCMLDLSINIAMEPFRAFVADKLPDEQRTAGFAMQSFFIGVGAAVAGFMPTILTFFGLEGSASNGIPLSVFYSFRIGALVMLVAVAWTIFTTSEYPPEDMEAFKREKANRKPLRFNYRFIAISIAVCTFFAIARGVGVDANLTIWHVLVGACIGAMIGMVLGQGEISEALVEMPVDMKKLAVVQFFTWFGLFCFWMFFGLATAQQVFGTTDATSAAFDQGMAFSGQTTAWYSIVCFLVAFALDPLVKIAGRRYVHCAAMLLGGFSLLACGFITGGVPWQLTMIGFGIAWASILSIPYALLSGVIPPTRIGVYMGIFNMFIVIPQMVAALCLEPIVKAYFHGDPVKVIMLAGVSFCVAGLYMLTIRQTKITIPERNAGHPAE